ncbi:centriolar coiled-coil protein of 110 kDa isoform X2 [Ochotona curzoniae]|uniref:centriolar coiled-coil protein of 110 kDa isoform X2 n=1 Tax=Ochotona curzoniae TaxID=130825 RepID=UPI001B34DF0E|nr:centriolar coiled-coil protein of 110 kDa isoform X2 [Ochotona curzoniae]
MEEYETFCEKSLARIHSASRTQENFLPALAEGTSLIHFHGVAVLSPLLNVEKRKEMQQERQKALDVEARKQEKRKKALLSRVQEIIDSVQVRKAPNASDFDQWEEEVIYSNSDIRNLNAPDPPANSLPSPPTHVTLAKLEKITGILPLDNEDLGKADEMDLAGDLGGLISAMQRDRSDVSNSEKEASPKTSPTMATAQQLPPPRPATPLPPKEDQDPALLADVIPDPYVLSLQNLMKKSKEYLAREQSRRGLRGSVRSSIGESHSDKENDAVQAPGSVEGKAPPVSSHCGSCGSVVTDQPSLPKSSAFLQGAAPHASSMSVSVIASSPQGDLPVQTSHPTSADSDSDFHVTPPFATENNVIKSLTGSYAKLPSPEPSVSPQMHRRRSRPSSTCHILINNPINACELSPKGKEQAVDLILEDRNEKPNVPETVPKLPMDLAGVCSSKVYISKTTSEAKEETALGKSDQACQSPGHQIENKVSPGLAAGEGRLTSDERGAHGVPRPCAVVPRLPEPYAASQPVASHSFGALSGLKSASMSEKNCSLQMELNKSYDVKNPSPLLMQNQNPRQQVDTPAMSGGSEKFLDNSLEKVKRRLDLDIDSFQKENYPYGLVTGMAEQERSHLPEKRYPKGSVYNSKNKILETSFKGEGTLKSKILAFEEMRKRLEEQHAQQLSLLIAEQEKEQERLQKEIEEQERMLKEKKAATLDASELDINNAVDLEWRKINDSGLLESMLSQMDSLHTSALNSSGFTNSALQYSFGSASEAPFYLWGSSTSGLTKLSGTRPFGRAKARWSQVVSPEVQAKFNKITAVAKGFLTRRLMQTDKLKQLRQTVKDTMEFIRSFQSEAPLKRGAVSAQDASLQERVLAQLRAALYGIHDIFFVMDAAERMSILHHDREVRKEKMLRQMDKMKSPRVALSAATQKSLDRKKFMKAAEMGMPNKKFLVKQNPAETRVLQPIQGQNAPAHRLLSRQGTPKTSVKGVVHSRQKPSQSRVPNRAPVAGVYAGKIQRKRPNVATI